MAQQPPRPPDDGSPMGSGEPRQPPPSPPTTPPDPAGTPATWGAGPEFQLPAPPADDPTGYLRANAGRYTRDALTARLASAGHPPEAIAEAWATVDAEDAAEGRRDRRGSVSKLIAGAYLLTWLGITLMWIATDASQLSGVWIVSGVLAIFLFIPGVVAFASARGSRRLRRAGIGTAVAFVIAPMLILAVLAGTCLVLAPPGWNA